MGHGTWDAMDLTDWCLFSTVRSFFLHSFFGIHGKGPGGLGLGSGWVVGSSHFFYFFWNACMVVYGFAWFDRVGFLWEKKVSSQRGRER